MPRTTAILRSCASCASSVKPGLNANASESIHVVQHVIFILLWIFMFRYRYEHIECMLPLFSSLFAMFLLFMGCA